MTNHSNLEIFIMNQKVTNALWLHSVDDNYLIIVKSFVDIYHISNSWIRGGTKEKGLVLPQFWVQQYVHMQNVEMPIMQM